ncbi:hypothetical protein ABZP36_023973 [Zizania latifolia]
MESRSSNSIKAAPFEAFVLLIRGGALPPAALPDVEAPPGSSPGSGALRISSSPSVPAAPIQPDPHQSLMLQSTKNWRNEHKFLPKNISREISPESTHLDPRIQAKARAIETEKPERDESEVCLPQRPCGARRS